MTQLWTEPPEASFDDAVDNAADKATADQDEQEPRQSQASAIVEFVESRADLFHDNNKDVFATDRGTNETRRIDGRQFRDWLSAEFYAAEGKALRDQSIREALGTLAGLGRFRSEKQDVFLRVAGAGGRYTIDMAEPGTSRAIEVYPGGWQVINRPAVRFYRTEAMQQLPEPVGTWDIGDLWKIANIPKESRLLVITWLIECIRPETPFPPLELLGEQGSAKSTTHTALKRLIDPSACDLRGAPRSAEDVFVSAGVNWIVSYENVSHLPAPMQDAFCVLSTGGGFAKRKLYSDADESVIQVKRPLMLNGISACVTAQDLIDRTISVETPVIVERHEVTDLWREFDANRPRILGALLNIAGKALELLPSINLPPRERPRMAEFARLGMAVAAAMGREPEEFMEEFNASRQESIGRTIDASPVASAAMDWLAANPGGKSDSVKNLFAEFERFKPAGTDAWPRTAKGFADALRRAAPALRQMEIECVCHGKGSGGVVRWSITPRVKLSNSCPKRPKSQIFDADELGHGTSGTSEQQLYSDGAPADDDDRPTWACGLDVF